MNWCLLLIAIPLIGGMLSGLASKPGAWYDSLRKSDLSPPPAAFGIVWPILYLLIGIALYNVVCVNGARVSRLLLGLFVLNLVFNWSFSPVFFLGKSVLGGFLMTTLSLLTALAVIGILVRTGLMVAASLLIPYILWLGFATYLSWDVLRKNT